jgi:hypothetical protein
MKQNSARGISEEEGKYMRAPPPQKKKKKLVMRTHVNDL